MGETKLKSSSVLNIHDNDLNAKKNRNAEMRKRFLKEIGGTNNWKKIKGRYKHRFIHNQVNC